jgi:hypothetical protein
MLKQVIQQGRRENRTPRRCIPHFVLCRSPLEILLANGETSTAFQASERPPLNVEVFDRLRTQLGAYFSILASDSW